MPFNDKQTSTVSWAKDKTTSTYHAITGRLLQNSFIKRNKKSIIIGSVIWLVINIAGSIYFNTAEDKAQNDFLQAGIETALNMKDKIRSPLLENDILSLNVAIGELEKKIKPVFSTILDHNQNVIVHSNPDAVNSKLNNLIEKKIIGVFDDVEVNIVDYMGNKEITTFCLPIFFSKIKIGKILFGLNSAKLEKTISAYNLGFIILVVLTTILFIIALFFTNKAIKNKISKNLAELENLQKVGPYFLKKKIAQGGMAELYLAEYIREHGFKRVVIIKKILPHLAQNQDFLDMFIREARLAAKLQHPNIVQIFDLIEALDTRFIAMEYIDGKNLHEIMVIEQKGLPVDLSIYIIQKISLGLYYSHSKVDDKTGKPLYIVHRDVNPQNMLISYRGEVKISDYGISKAKSEPSFTQVGVIKGKLSYLSPEQALGKDVDHQADIYALGIIFYEILAGKKLYKFENELEAIRTIPVMEIPDITLERPDVPQELKAVLEKCLEKDKTRRYQNAKELHDDLVKIKHNFKMRYNETDLADFMNCNIRPGKDQSDN